MRKPQPHNVRNSQFDPERLPKCTSAIHSENPQFWRKWKENLDNLAKQQLLLLSEETRIQINALKNTLRVSPWVHQADVLHAISPISMKLGQFKGSTPKLKMTN